MQEIMGITVSEKKFSAEELKEKNKHVTIGNLCDVPLENRLLLVK